VTDQLENTMNQTTSASNINTDSAKSTAMVVYALQAASFIVGITFLVAVIISYIKKDDATGTWVASHYKWQIRTFWFSFLWTILGLITAIFIIGYFILLVDMIWVIYRIAKGWIRLSESKEMYS